MLLWIPVALTVIGIVVLIISKAIWKKRGWRSERLTDGLDVTGKVVSSVSAVIVAIEVVVLICSYSGLKGEIAADMKRFESLTYQYEKFEHGKPYTMGDYRLLSDIQEWNEDVAWHQESQHDLWIGPFVPDIYDQYEFIALNLFMTEAEKEAAQ